ncbi:hypothetical protein VTL71DRAFT_8617 [Oculimacula yallundae]|uniref:Zn(2)-C6 fungal-type domain-containing protein n=1 Tax=Oculimacula yallundae TaxID=86028 RepID=A0ABR4CY40_9HELO
MPRRPHQKSRNGCLQCKKRHVKCNEARPNCQNCQNTSTTCVYLNAAPASAGRAPTVPMSNHTSALPSPAATNPATASSYWSPASDPPILEQNQGSVNLLHLELLHHAKSAIDTVDCYGISKEECREALEEVIQIAFRTPYLMHEILSLAATRLSMLRPGQSVYLRNHATELQTSALSIFNIKMQTPSDDTTADHVSKFVFSSLLGSQMLHDTIIYRNGDFSVFINDFVRYLRVTKGVTIHIRQSEGCWEALHQTSLRPFLEAGHRSLEGGTATFSPECETLAILLRSADVSPASAKVYKETLEFLQAAYYAHRQAADGSSGLNSSPLLYGARTGAYAWPILVPTEYAELLLQQRPEALAILAHFAILLHRYRDNWMIGDGGRYIIEAITKYLGPSWEQWLASPNEELRNDP